MARPMKRRTVDQAEAKAVAAAASGAQNATFLNSPFEWNDEREKAAKLLAEGYSITYASKQVGVDRTTVYNWLEHAEFIFEVDRLTLIVGMSKKSERIRFASKRIRTLKKSTMHETDLRGWVKDIRAELESDSDLLDRLADRLTKDA